MLDNPLTASVGGAALEAAPPGEPCAHRPLQAARPPSPSPPTTSPSQSAGRPSRAVRAARRPLLLRQLPPHRQEVLPGARLGLPDEVDLCRIYLRGAI